jgi:hypothetical protein
MTINCYQGFDVRALSVGNAFTLTLKRGGESNATISATALANQTTDGVFLFMHEKTIESIVQNNATGNTPCDGIWSDKTLEQALDAACTSAVNGWAGSPAINWTFSSGGYTVTVDDSTVFGMSAANAMTNGVLGLVAAVTGATVYTSTNMVYFYNESTLTEVSDVSDVYEADGGSSVAFSDNGYPQESISRTDGVKYFDFTLQFESKARAFIETSGGTQPWSWELAFQHCRCNYPMYFENTHWAEKPTPGITGDPIVLLREDGAAWRPTRAAPDYDDYWHIPFRTYLIGWSVL